MARRPNNWKLREGVEFSGSDNSAARLFGEQLEQITIESDTPSIEITSGFDSDYNRYVLEFTNMSADTGEFLTYRVTTDGGSTYLDGSDDYKWSRTLQDDAGDRYETGSSGTDSKMEAFGKGSSEPKIFNGVIHTSRATDDFIPSFRGSWVANDGVLWEGSFSGIAAGARGFDGLRFEYPDGNITNGEIVLYGLML